MRKSNHDMQFGLLWSLIHPVRPETVAGSQATLTPSVSRPVHDKGAQARLSGEVGNKQRSEKAGYEPSCARRARRKPNRRQYCRATYAYHCAGGTALAEKNSFYPGGSTAERRTRD